MAEISTSSCPRNIPFPKLILPKYSRREYIRMKICRPSPLLIEPPPSHREVRCYFSIAPSTQSHNVPLQTLTHFFCIINKTRDDPSRSVKNNDTRLSNLTPFGIRHEILSVLETSRPSCRALKSPRRLKLTVTEWSCNIGSCKKHERKYTLPS